VLLRQLHWHALQALFVVSLQCGKENTITVNDDEAKLFVIFEKRVERFRLERVLATVREHVDGPERLQVNRDFLLSLAIFEKDNAAEDHQTILWSVFVQFQLFTSGGDSLQDRLARLSILDIFSSSQLICQHLVVFGQRVLRWDV